MRAVAKPERKNAAELARCGISLEMIRAEKREPRLFLCAVRGLLIFMAVFGTLAGLVSAFDLDFKYGGVAFLLFAISMFIAFIYYNKLTFYVGYILLLTGFAWFSTRYFAYINSGFQAFLNVAAKIYGSFFHLTALREATELVEDRYLTVSAVMIFLGAMLALLLNISISAYMSLFLTFLITFLPLQIAFYVNRNVPLPYLMMLLAVYISVMVLKRSGNFALPSKYGKEHIFEKKSVRTGNIFKRIAGFFLASDNKKTVHKYLVSGSGMISVAGYAAAIATVFLLVMNGMLEKTANNDEITNTVKTVTDEYVKTIAQGGISALFNRYDSTGGLSKGQLGGVGSVNPDFETDLVIRFVPYSSDSLYLRAYVGKSYADNRFWPTFKAGESELSGRSLFDSSGRNVYERGWCDDDYLPVVPGNEADGPVAIDGVSDIRIPETISYIEKSDVTSITVSGKDNIIVNESGETEGFRIPEDAVIITVDSVYSTVKPNVVRENLRLLNSIMSYNEKNGRVVELTTADQAKLTAVFAEARKPDEADISRLGWDRYAKIGIVNTGADASTGYVPYDSFYLGDYRNDNTYLISNRWKNFRTLGSVVGNFIYSDLMSSEDMLYATDGLAELQTEYEAIDRSRAVFFPYEESIYYQPNPTLSSDYERYVYEHYLDVPDEMRETLKKIASEAGIDVIAGQAESIKEKYSEGTFSFYSEIINSGLDQTEQESLFSAYRSYLKTVADLYDFGPVLSEYGLIDAGMSRGEDGDITREQLQKMNLYAADLLSGVYMQTMLSSVYYLGDDPVIYGNTYDRLKEMVEKQVEIKPITGYECAADEVSYDDYLAMQRLRLQLLRTLKNFYMREFSYTMSPGRTPSGKDVIDYFLTSRRRGFCAHFASSACLLLRSVGIPARYVEGYVVHSDDVAQGRLYDNDTSEWKYGDYGFPDSAVVDVEISDASAHAWIEVYIDGHGWIPYEMTPPSEGENLGGGLFGFLSNIITGRQSPQSRYVNNDNNNGADGADGSTESGEKNVYDGINFLLIPLLWLTAIFVAVLLAVYVCGRLTYVIRLKKLEKNAEYSQALLLRYRSMLKKLKRKGIVAEEYPTVRAVFDRIHESAAAYPDVPDVDLAETINLAAFSASSIDEASYKDALDHIAALKKIKYRVG